MCGLYQSGNPNAFNSSISGNVGLESWYIDGVSLTHGPPGARKHIWSFVNAWIQSVHTKCAYKVCTMVA